MKAVLENSLHKELQEKYIQGQGASGQESGDTTL